MRFLSIGAGGFLGAVCRYYLGSLLNSPNVAAIPAGTLLINLIGCFFLAFFLTAAVEYFKLGVNFRLAVGTGFVGAFTTFSTFSLETVKLLEYNQSLTALSYVLLSVAGGISLSYCGVAAARWLCNLVPAKQMVDQN